MRFQVRVLIHCLLGTTTLLSVTPLLASTTYTWTGATSGDWASANNWTPHGVPGAAAQSTDKAQFGSASRTSITLGVEDDIDADSLVFLSGAPAYTITLSAHSDSGLLNGIVNHSANRPGFIVAGNANLNFLGGDAADSLITNAGSIQFDAALGSPTITNQSGGNIFLANSAPLDANAATIVNASNAMFVADGAAVSVGSISGAGNIKIFSELTVGSLGRNETISGAISNQGSSGALTKVGSGALTLAGANTYTGQTRVESGTLQVDGSLASTGEVVVSGTPESVSAILGGGGSVGNVTLQVGAVLVPGNANANSSLTMSRLSCTTTNNPVYQRIGSSQNNGDGFQGTFLILQSALSARTCPDLAFKFLSAGKPLYVGETFPIVIIAGTTNYTTANLSYDFTNFPGYTQAQGHFNVLSVSASFSLIDFVVDDLGDDIFKNGFQ